MSRSRVSPRRSRRCSWPFACSKNRSYQKRKKILGRELEIGIFSSDGELLSDQKSVRFEHTDTEPRNREVIITLTLGHRVSDFNNQNLELRLMEKIGGTSHQKNYDTAIAKFVKPFETEIDEF